ncbi:hypothetical protein SprV_0200559600 [Sparganum proliferum]
MANLRVPSNGNSELCASNLDAGRTKVIVRGKTAYIQKTTISRHLKFDALHEELFAWLWDLNIPADMAITIFAADVDIKKGQLDVFQVPNRKLNVREDGGLAIKSCLNGPSAPPTFVPCHLESLFSHLLSSCGGAVDQPDSRPPYSELLLFLRQLLVLLKSPPVHASDAAVFVSGLA